MESQRVETNRIRMNAWCCLRMCVCRVRARVMARVVASVDLCCSLDLLMAHWSHALARACSGMTHRGIHPLRKPAGEANMTFEAIQHIPPLSCAQFIVAH